MHLFQSSWIHCTIRAKDERQREAGGEIEEIKGKLGEEGSPEWEKVDVKVMTQGVLTEECFCSTGLVGKLDLCI